MRLKYNAGSIFNDNHRFRVAVCGRRFGKTRLLSAELIRAATAISNASVWYLAPSYRSAKQIMWEVLKETIPAPWVRSKQETDLSIKLINNSIISLRGADNPDSLRGVGLHFAGFDEYDFMRSNVWPEIIRPMLATTGGKSFFCGTPDGFSQLYDLYNRGQSIKPEDDDWSSYQFTTLDGEWVPQEEIEASKNDMDDRTFLQEYLASFQTSSGRVYYAFSRDENIRELPQAIVTLPISFGCDFNVDPMTAVIFAETTSATYVIDEIVIKTSNTFELTQEIKNRYGSKVIDCYPDPSGRSLKTSAEIGRSDHAILKQAGFNVLSRKSTLSVRDGINAVNSRLCSSNNARRLFISKKCQHLIKALEGHSYKPGTSIPNQDGYEHILDSLRYPMEFLHPIIQRECWTQ